MPGKPSKRMKDAMELVRAGLTPYQAAVRVGVAKSTMYRSKLYQAWQDEIQAKARPRRAQQPSPEMRLAIRLAREGKPAAEAIRTAGVSRGAFYQSSLYRAWMAERKTATGPA